MRAFANRMVTGRAGAVIAGAIDAQVRAVAAGACVALIVVPFVLAVCVPVMQVVYVI
ncbi:dihydrofolate reductase [Rothia dentocariosa]|uniref:dihydrofolate reductase n=1 Tax=Rothia dentocariosa TaxID=2047 RepID=UPI00244C17EC